MSSNLLHMPAKQEGTNRMFTQSRIASRREAGRKLGEVLSTYAGRKDVIVLALPRGGVPIAREIADALGAEMDVLLVRKIGVPGYRELAMGAIASSGAPIVDSQMVREFGLTPEQVEETIAESSREMARQESAYRKGMPMLELQGKTVILVDDGIATGHTMRAAAAAAKRMGAAHVIIATGVAPLSTVSRLQKEVDEVVCLITPRDFQAVGSFYEDFSQVSDDEVKSLLNRENKGPDGNGR